MKRRIEKPWVRGSKSERGPLKEERGRGRAPINFSSLVMLTINTDRYRLYLSTNVDRHFRIKFEMRTQIFYADLNILF